MLAQLRFTYATVATPYKLHVFHGVSTEKGIFICQRFMPLVVPSLLRSLRRIV